MKKIGFRHYFDGCGNEIYGRYVCSGGDSKD